MLEAHICSHTVLWFVLLCFCTTNDLHHGSLERRLGPVVQAALEFD